MRITVCSSMRNKEKMRELIKVLKQKQMNVLFPDLDFKIPNSGMTQEIRKELQDKHFSKIKSSDIVYILTPDRHIGRMVNIEIGYAKALGKRIIFSQETNKIDLDMFADGFMNVDDMVILCEKNKT